MLADRLRVIFDYVNVTAYCNYNVITQMKKVPLKAVTT